ncbi:hypothetical protein OG535_30680 [Kitasatospora sp. NBC_00085]|uniref:hypothetical protein n=1 Tax=Kitasatospora sp. NBC_00085 TaxID=2903566 RepID=UPI00324F0441
MTVLHSRNADAADAADAKAADAATADADANDAKDLEQTRSQAADTDLRDELGRYAELGAFTLTAETHAWYAAVDTVATPEDARAASTVLAELRGRDLQQTWEAVTTLAADAKLDEPGTIAVAALFAETLQRVHQTSATLTGAAYDADLAALVAATADRTWRRERGVKLSFLKVRALRKQAAALAAGGRKVRPEELHEALASAEIERRAWAVLAPTGALPVPPADGALAEGTAAAFDAIGAGLRDLGGLLPEHDLDALPFGELIDLVERLAADEGTLYRLPAIRSLRTSLEEAGLGELLAELTAARADRRAAEAAFSARQALAGGQRDGLTGREETTEAVSEPAAEVEAEADVATEVEATEPEVVAEDVTEDETEVDAEDETDAVGVVEADVEADVEAAAEVEAEAEQATAEEPVEVRPVVVTLPAPSPAADDLVDVISVTAMAEVEPAEVEPEAVAETVADIEPAVAEEPQPVVVEPEIVAPVAETETVAVIEPEVEAAGVEVDAPVEAVEVEPVEAEPVAAEVEVEAVVEESAPEVVTPVAEVEALEVDAPVEAVEVEPVEAGPVAAEVEADAVAEEPEAVEVVAETEPEAVVAEETAEETTDEAEPEPVAEAEPEPVVVPEPVAEAEPEPVAEAEPEPVVVPEPVAAAEPAAAGQPEKPDFTPGRPVTAYSADELLAVVRWVDADGVERSEEELLRAAMKELGFARLGPRIKEALGAAVTAARA